MSCKDVSSEDLKIVGVASSVEELLKQLNDSDDDELIDMTQEYKDELAVWNKDNA